MKFIDHSDEAKETLKDATIQWLFQACVLVEGQAVALATVQTARLRNSIDHHVDEAELTGYVGTNVEYADYVNSGTRYQEAQPYFDSAVEKNEEKLDDALDEIIERLLE